jgi:hypothetical protein
VGEVIYRLLIGRAEGKETFWVVGVGRLKLKLIFKELRFEVMNRIHPAQDTIL